MTFVATISIITIPAPFLFFTLPLSTFLIEGLLNFALFSKIKYLCVEKLSSVFPCVLYFPEQSNNCNKPNKTKPAYICWLTSLISPTSITSLTM